MLLLLSSELLQDRGNSIKFTTLVRELEPASSITANKVILITIIFCHVLLLYLLFFFMLL
jgi:hypothetical protein